MINVVIADSSFIVREGLKRIIDDRQRFKVIGEIKNSNEFWVKLNSLKPQVLIMDYESLNQIEALVISRIKEFLPDTKVFVLSNHKEKQNVINAVQQGALVYVTKDCEEEEVITAIDKIARGEKYFCSEILDILIDKQEGPKKNGLSENLTEREVEIIKLIVKGNSNPDIAEKLFLSIHTVYTHRKNIMRKLKLKSPVELVLYALNSGLAEK